MLARNWNPHTLIVGKKSDTLAAENSSVFPQKVKHGTILWSSSSTPSYIPKRTENMYSKYLFTNVHNIQSALHNSQKTGNNPKCHQLINKFWYITQWNIIAIKRNEVMIHATTRKNHVNIKRRSQLQRTTYYIFTWNFQNR